MKAIRTNLCCQRLLSCGVSGSDVGVEFVTASDDFVSVRQSFRRVGDVEGTTAATAATVVAAAASKFLLEQIEFRFDFTGLTISPGLVVRVLGVVRNEFTQVYYLIGMRDGFDGFDPGSRAEPFDGLNFGRRRVNDRLDLCGHAGYRWIIGKCRR